MWRREGVSESCHQGVVVAIKIVGPEEKKKKRRDGEKKIRRMIIDETSLHLLRTN